MYVIDTGDNRVEEWAPVNEAAHDTQTIYYSSAANTTYPACGEHPEWVNLVCQTQPGGQPEDGQNLPVKTFIYNVWDEIEKTTETYGSTKRTITQTYDAAGRALTSETASTIDTALPKVTNEYNTETGALEKQSTTTGGKTKTITSKDNTLGQLTKYTDADGNTSTYEYEPEGDDRLEEVNDGKGTQTYSYDTTTGFLTKLIDSAAGTFTASYDVEGKMLTEGYPNNMTADYTFNQLGQATGLSYEKNAHCATKCPETWFSDTVVPSIHGETLAQTSTLAKDNYTYDNAGRLTQTQEEPAGKGCVTRIYAYDEESNRTSLTTREPGTEGKCATEGGSVERHTYDTANRLTDTGVAYEAFGNTTALPAADAGGHELTSGYYVDGQIASQTQSEKTINYHYDPAGRTEETETLTKGKLESTVISHYSGAGEALTWTSEEEGKKWSRNIPGIDGALDAIQTSSGTTTLQLHDLQGNIIAKAAVSESETKLLETYNSTEFGVPNEGKAPPKYAWLGATGVSTELSSGVATKGGASYVPQIARNLQTEPVIPPGAFPDGESEATPYTASISSAEIESGRAISMKIAEEIEASRQAANRRKAEEEIRRHAEEEGSEVDPGKCTAVGDLNQSQEANGHNASPYANFHCSGAGDDVQISLCLLARYSPSFKDCWDEGKPLKKGNEGSGQWAEFGLPLKSFQCTVGESYILWVWYWEAGMKKGDVGYGKWETCHEDGDEIELEELESLTPVDP